MQLNANWLVIFSLCTLTACIPAPISQKHVDGETFKVTSAIPGRVKSTFTLPDSEWLEVTNYAGTQAMVMHSPKIFVSLLEKERYVRTATGCVPTFVPKSHGRSETEPNIAFYDLKC